MFAAMVQGFLVLEGSCGQFLLALVVCIGLGKILAPAMARRLRSALREDLEVFIAPYGKVWHTDAECKGLAGAKSVSSRRFCKVWAAKH